MLLCLLIIYVGALGKHMLEFIVLGKVPGTHIQVDFMLVLIVAALLLALLLTIILFSHIWKRLLDATRKMLTLEHLTI